MNPNNTLSVKEKHLKNMLWSFCSVQKELTRAMFEALIKSYDTYLHDYGTCPDSGIVLKMLLSDISRCATLKMGEWFESQDLYKVGCFLSKVLHWDESFIIKDCKNKLELISIKDIRNFCGDYLDHIPAFDTLKTAKKDVIRNFCQFKIIAYELGLTEYLEPLSRYFLGIYRDSKFKNLFKQIVDIDNPIIYRRYMVSPAHRAEDTGKPLRYRDLVRVTITDTLDIILPEHLMIAFCYQYTRFRSDPILSNGFVLNYSPLKYFREVVQSSSSEPTYFPIIPINRSLTGTTYNTKPFHQYYRFTTVDKNGRLAPHSPLFSMKHMTQVEFMELIELGILNYTKKSAPMFLEISEPHFEDPQISFLEGINTQSRRSLCIGTDDLKSYGAVKTPRSRLGRFIRNLVRYVELKDELVAYTYHLENVESTMSFVKEMTKKYKNIKKTLDMYLNMYK